VIHFSLRELPFSEITHGMSGSPQTLEGMCIAAFLFFLLCGHRVLDRLVADAFGVSIERHSPAAVCIAVAREVVGEMFKGTGDVLLS
jgi:hypothetical protein